MFLYRNLLLNSFENYPMSWKPSIDKTKKPIYKVLARQLQQDILNGVLLPGTRLPSQRELADLGGEAGIFRWLLLPSKITGVEFERLAAQQGVQVYAADRFVVGNSSPERAVRIAVCALETPEELEEGLMILHRLLKELTSHGLPYN